MLPAPAFVLSDLHLGAAPREVEQLALRFLRAARERAGSLVINGDLFDFWFAWRTVMPRTGFRVLAGLADVVEAGVPVLWLAGNHDCWGGDTLRAELGVDYRQDWRGRLAGWETYLHHGDGLRELEDRKYRRVRTVLRHPLSVRAFRWLHPDLGSRLAMGSSGASRAHRSHDEGAGLERVAFAHMEADPRLELVVFGHSHVPALARAPGGGVYANAGSWLDAPTFLHVTPERVELRRYDGSGEGERLDLLDRRAEEALPEP
ncbi:MAG TPA: UDP-2,3-diacylglucosamine diphosphatase [Gemmatimonadaceae bacterium]|nr:UDP-2,3-diacylglucosamine diphosphatase [Gemmatimonadaceae bacterium]